MTGRALLLAAGGVLLAAGVTGGVWWQRQRSAAQVRAQLVSAAQVELERDPTDRAALVQADRDLARLAATDPDPSLYRARARIALHLRLPDAALQQLDEVTFRGHGSSEDLELRARALALRHAVGGRVDDARQAMLTALEHHQATGSVASALLAWQCATRIDDQEQSAAVAARMAAAHADAWESQVVQALHAFDPEQPATGEPLRRLQLEGPALPELDAALAMLDVLDADDSVRARGIAAIQRVLNEVPASKPARLVAVLAHDRIGDVPGRNAHLQWLITNFPQDERAEKWRELAQHQ